jgi:hypothetical protein
MMSKNDWFRVDKAGLAQVYARRGPAAPFFELISNALDEEGVTKVELTVTAIPNSPKVEIRCTDDSSQGFRDLDDAYTLFAPSYKKGAAEQRGRFNVGEKLFLALCEAATIISTGGTLVFQDDGTLRRTGGKTQKGTDIWARMRMTRDEAREAFDELVRVIAPDGVEIRITFVGFDDTPQEHNLRRTTPCGLTFKAQLQTELSDSEGVIRPTQRVGHVEVWDADDPDGGWLFELGIPVVEIGGPFDIDVHQKVPLNVERDNVKPAFLRRVRAHVLNCAYERITSEADARKPWVDEAMGSQNPRPSADALKHIMDLRFGKKRVSYDPSDKEGSHIAMSRGYTVVHGGSLSAEVWENVRATETIKPAGKVTPSPKAVFASQGSDVSIPPKEYPTGGREVCQAFEAIAARLTKDIIKVRIVKRLQGNGGSAPAACYGNREILLNLRRLGRAWFRRVIEDGRLSEDHVELLVHELGHYYESNHLKEGFHESQTKLGVRLAFIAGSEFFVSGRRRRAAK